MVKIEFNRASYPEFRCYDTSWGLKGKGGYAEAHLSSSVKAFDKSYMYLKINALSLFLNAPNPGPEAGVRFVRKVLENLERLPLVHLPTYLNGAGAGLLVKKLFLEDKLVWKIRVPRNVSFTDTYGRNSKRWALGKKIYLYIPQEDLEPMTERALGFLNS